MIEDVIAKCIGVMVELRRHPVCAAYTEQFGAKALGNIDAIERKLVAGQYKKVDEWRTEMLTAIQGSNSHVTGNKPDQLISKEMERLFRLKTRSITDNDNEAWFIELINLRKDVKALIKARITQLSEMQSLPTADVGSVKGKYTSLKEIRRFFVGCLTNADIAGLAEALNNSSEEMGSKIAAIITQYNPEITLNGRQEIDLGILPPSTLLALRVAIDSV